MGGGSGFRLIGELVELGRGRKGRLVWRGIGEGLVKEEKCRGGLTGLHIWLKQAEKKKQRKKGGEGERN